jgi:hypothetical protein
MPSSAVNLVIFVADDEPGLELSSNGRHALKESARRVAAGRANSLVAWRCPECGHSVRHSRHVRCGHSIVMDSAQTPECAMGGCRHCRSRRWCSGSEESHPGIAYDLEYFCRKANGEARVS